MGNLIGKIIGGFFILAFLFAGLSSCNLGAETGGYDCPPGGCAGEPQGSEFEYVVP